MKYVTSGNMLLFDQSFNEPLTEYLDIISNYNIIIFNDYKLDIKQNYDNFYTKYEDDIYCEILNNYRGPFNDNDNNKYILSRSYYGSIFNQSIDNLPLSVTHLTLGYNFSQPINSLPSSLTHLTFGGEFNHPIDNLPSSLTHLTLGYLFDQPIDNLPPTLTHLTLGNNFNQPVDLLPSGLTHLSLGGIFNRPIDNLPSALTHLILSFNFNQPINNLPSGLTHLTINGQFNQPINLSTLPKSLKYLTFGSVDKYPNELPSTVTHLTLKRNFLHPIDSLPFSLSSITHLIVTYEYYTKYEHIINSYKTLKVEFHSKSELIYYD